MNELSGGGVDLGIPGVGAAELVGRGGFGLVYRATQLSSGGVVAVKVAATHLDDTGRARFERETRALGTLRGHPGICTVYDAGVDPAGRPYLIMEYATSSLAQLIDEGGPLPWPDVIDLGERLAGALEAAHQAGLLHRDVKPENVLRTAFGEWRLADFGLVRHTSDTLSATLTTTVTHAAPELLHGHGHASVASDVYALGSTLFVALTGRAAFAAADDSHPVSIYRRIAEDPIPDMPHVPPPIVDVVRQAMAKDPSHRFPTAAAMATALQRAGGEAEAAGFPVMPIGAAAAPCPHRDETIDVRTPANPDDLTKTVPRERPSPPREDDAPTEPRRPSGRVLLAAGAAFAVVVLVVAGVALRSGDGDADGSSEGPSASEGDPGSEQPTTEEIRSALPSDGAWETTSLEMFECYGPDFGDCPSAIEEIEMPLIMECPEARDSGGECTATLFDEPSVPLSTDGTYMADVYGDPEEGGIDLSAPAECGYEVVYHLQFVPTSAQKQGDRWVATAIGGTLFAHASQEDIEIECVTEYMIDFNMRAQS